MLGCSRRSIINYRDHSNDQQGRERERERWLKLSNSIFREASEGSVDAPGLRLRRGVSEPRENSLGKTGRSLVIDSRSQTSIRAPNTRTRRIRSSINVLRAFPRRSFFVLRSNISPLFVSCLPYRSRDSSSVFFSLRRYIEYCLILFVRIVEA